MATAALHARLRFLQASAHLYSTSDPATSAHLMLEHSIVASSTDNPARGLAKSSLACTACGTIEIPGWTSRTTIVDPNKTDRTSSKRGKKTRRETPEPCVSEKQVVVECLTCRRTVTTRLPKLPGRGKSRQTTAKLTDTSLKKSSTATAMETSTSKLSGQGSQRVVSANSSSKKRAKGRKQGGLQAMLEMSREQGNTSPGFGLDLMDLMKKV